MRQVREQRHEALKLSVAMAMANEPAAATLERAEQYRAYIDDGKLPLRTQAPNERSGGPHVKVVSPIAKPTSPNPEKVFCAQCDRMVWPSQAQACASQFCSLRAA